MNGEDAASSRARRMLPSVSEVLKELTARAPIEPDIAFRAAREVCAEELKRIRDAGGDSVPIEELVQRALVRASGVRPPVPVPAAPPMPPPPAPVPGPAEPPALPDETAADDPFSETAGMMDLRWEREAREPFSEPQGAPAPFALPAEPDDSAASAPEPPAILLSEPERGPEEGAGPGDETLSRLSREAESIDLNSVFPRPHESSSAPEAFSMSGDDATSGEDAANVTVAPPFADDEDTVLTIPRGGGRRGGGEEKGTRFGVVLGVALGLVALAGLGYVLVGLWMERDAAPPPASVARSRRPATVPTAAPAAAPTEAGPQAPSATPVVIAAATPRTPPVASPAPAIPLPAPAAAATRAAAMAPAPKDRSVRLPVALPTSTPAAPAPTLVRTTPVRQSRDGLVVTRDRAGQPEVFSIHFTSYKDRASAERDLKRVEALAGMRGYVAEVDLGEKGVWYRVMAGAFATSQEAKAARDALSAKGTRDMGWVYRVVGSD